MFLISDDGHGMKTLTRICFGNLYELQFKFKMPMSQGNVIINKPIPMNAQITWRRKSLGIWNEHFAHANNGMILQMF
jgi:hypothetical protein